jgi:hypothetical protein
MYNYISLIKIDGGFWLNIEMPFHFKKKKKKPFASFFVANIFNIYSSLI